MIDAATILKIFSTYAGCWALGYVVGIKVAYVKKLAQAA